MQSLPFKKSSWETGGATAGIAILALSAICLAGAAPAADLMVMVVGLRSAAGSVRVAVCPEASFLTASCPHAAAAPASQSTVRIRDVPPGTYAIQVFHDENGDGKLDRGRFGRPLEGMAFSRDAPMRLGPPRFSDAAFRLGDDNARATLTMRYFQ